MTPDAMQWVAVAVVAIGVVLVLTQRTPVQPVVTESVPPEKPVTVLVVSASDMHGGYADQNGQLQRYNPTPVEMMAQATPDLVWIDRSVNGMKATEALAGGAVASAVPGTGEQTTTDSLAKLLDGSPEVRVLYWGCWLVDVLFAGMTPAQFVAMLDQVIDTAQARGVVPVMRGAHQFVCNGLMTGERLDRLAAFDHLLKAHCAARGVVVADMRAVPFEGAGSVCGDGLHPTKDYHQALAMAGAEVVRAVAAGSVIEQR